MRFLSSKLYYKYRANNKLHIKNILNDYWDSFLKQFPHLQIRDVVHSEVRKVRLCRTIALGYTRFDCPNCNNYSIVPHTCKSRFCSSCGNKYVNTRVIHSKKKLMKIKHRHIVFTIPEVLRNLFLVDRSRLRLFFDSVSETFNWMFNPTSYQNKKKEIYHVKKYKDFSCK